MRIDSHQHFWKYTPEEYPWIQADWSIRRDYLPDDAAVEWDLCQIDGCVAVQARQTLAETEWLLGLSDRYPRVKGVVGWVDLRSPEVGEQLARFSTHKKWVGVRHVVQDEPDDNFMLLPDFQRGISRLQEYNLRYDLLVFPRQLPAAIRLAKNFPNQPFVLDHIAKPSIKGGLMEPWSRDIQELASLPNVYCKVSGMITEAVWKGWNPQDFKSYLDVVCSAFGPGRLMYGSDWPVALLAGTYHQVYNLVREYIAPEGVETENAFFGGNAVKFYQLQ